MATQDELLKLLGHDNLAKKLELPKQPKLPVLSNPVSPDGLKSQKGSEIPQHEMPISYDYTRNFPLWLDQQQCSLLISTYKAHKLLCLGMDSQTGSVSLVFTNLLRPMGITYDKTTDTIYASNLGNIVQYENTGSEKHEKWGFFDFVFAPKRIDYCSDIDIHDLRVGLVKNGSNQDRTQVYYVSATLNSILTVSDHKSFSVYWTPKFISKNSDSKLGLFREDRCHLNGLAMVNGRPKYATAACMRDYYYAWKEHHGEGVVIDIETNEVVCANLWAPHSPVWYNNKLYLGEAGTGQFGFVDFETKKFVAKKFLPGFIRGITCHNGFAIVNISNDRHDTCFKHLPLGRILEEHGQTSMCSICIINLDTFEIVCHFEFRSLTEIYDIVALPKIVRPRIAELNESSKDVI